MIANLPYFISWILLLYFLPILIMFVLSETAWCGLQNFYRIVESHWLWIWEHLVSKSTKNATSLSFYNRFWFWCYHMGNTPSQTNHIFPEILFCWKVRKLKKKVTKNPALFQNSYGHCGAFISEKQNKYKIDRLCVVFNHLWIKTGICYCWPFFSLSLSWGGGGGGGLMVGEKCLYNQDRSVHTPAGILERLLTLSSD